MAIKILVVDDEPDVALIFRQKFRRRINSGELSFSFAENGRSALQMLEADPEISLVFTDLRMPGMDGLAFLRAMRGLERLVLLPLVVSAYDDMPNIREAMRQGAWDFITKPIELDELEQVLEAAITEIRQKQAAAEDRIQLRKAEQAREIALDREARQREFFENITHELRTPLSLVLAPLEQALDLSTEQKVIQHLMQAQKSGHILLELLNQLLDIAKLDAAQLQPRYSLQDLSPLIQEIVTAFQPLAARQSLSLHLQQPESLLLHADASLLARILINLLSNALKHSPPGAEVKVEIEALEMGLRLSVIDQGKGIAAEHQDKIFARFAQIPGSAGGTGIGLALCKAVAELMDAELSLRSQLGQGSTFQLLLPDHPDQSQAAFDSAPAMPKDFGAFPAFASDSQTEEDQAQILIVEDHPDMRNYVAGILAEKYHVHLAANGNEGWQMAQELIPDLILSDWMMPEMDGLELLRMVRQRRDTQHIPFLLLSAKSSLEDRLAGLETGAEAYLPKPFHPQELLGQIEGQLAARERLRKRFREEMLHPDKVEVISMEDQFLADLKRVMEAHLADDQFGVETLADALAMSRRTLTRKLTAVSGQPAVKFIRNYRLERGLQMLKENSAPIWEIALKTGFGSASYFTKCFREHYGISPKEAQQ